MAIGKTATRVWTEPAGTRSSRAVRVVKYHDTEVITATVPVNGRVNVTLDSGGYRTKTTKRRMNQASQQWGLSLWVYQHKGKWFVSSVTNGLMEFTDGMTFTETGME